MTTQPVLCQTWSETQKSGFLKTRLKSKNFKSDVEGLIKSYLELRMQDSRDEHFEPRKLFSIYIDTGVWVADVGVQNDLSIFWSKTWLYMSLVVRKLVFGVSDQVSHKPGCTASMIARALKFRI